MNKREKTLWYLTESILVPAVVSVLVTWLFLKLFY